MHRGSKVMEVEVRLEEVVLVKVFVTIFWVFSSTGVTSQNVLVENCLKFSFRERCKSISS